MVGPETVSGTLTLLTPPQERGSPCLMIENYLYRHSSYVFFTSPTKKYKYYFTILVMMAKKKRIPSKAIVSNTRKLTVDVEDRQKLDEFYDVANEELKLI